jgi:hypothetical protein
VERRINTNFSFNSGQAAVIDAAVNWYKNSPEQIFQISGNPGTGKSVVLNEIIHRLRLRMEDVAPMAYTGAAAIVMRMKGLHNAKTIHSWLYEPVEVPMRDVGGNIVMDTYLNRPKMHLEFRPRDLKHIKLIVIDEAGSVPESMRQHILNTGAKVLVAGDLDQLPPVSDNPAFLYTGYVHMLTEIVRQAEGSPIIYLSQRAKRGLPIHTGNYGDTVLVISEDEVTDDMLQTSHVVLCGRNLTRDRLNTYIRKQIYHKPSNLPTFGEKLICRKNNWTLEVGGINLTNGLTGTVVNHPDAMGFDGTCFTIDFVPDIASDICFMQIGANYKYLIADKVVKEEMKKTRWTEGNLFEFGYSQTVHLAQGSQWRCGMYYEEYMHPDINNKLNYTAITRFSDMCIYVKQKRKYY